MRIIAAAQIDAALDTSVLAERLRRAFRRRADAPAPVRYRVGGPDSEDTLILSPAWEERRFVGLRIETEFPNNTARGLPNAMGAYLLLDGRSGEPVALVDGPQLAARRAAATSALAAQYLARQDAERLLMIGAGNMAAPMIQAHATARPICNVLIWSRKPERAQRLAKRMNRRNFRVAATEDLPSAVQGAHVICCATTAGEPVLLGDWLQPGQHLDLIGARSATAREVDDAAIARARLFVDTRDGALATGELTIPIERGVITGEDIAADLYELTRGDRAGRRFYDQITLFKASGSGVADLAAAELLIERA
jgi:ornithine cyclodeaminase